MSNRESSLPSASQKSKTLLLFVSLCALAVTIAVLTAESGIIGGLVAFAVVVLLMTLGFTMVKPIVGFYMLYFYTFFMFLIGNLLRLEIPVSALVDVLIILTLVAIMINTHFGATKVQEESPFSSWIGYIIIASVSCDFLQVFNPTTHLPIDVNLTSFRESLYLIAVFYITYKIFSTSKLIQNYSQMLLLMSLSVAVYGIFQEVFGLRDFEWEWLRSDPRRFELYYQWGAIRKWSFLSDPSVYGMLMAFCGIVCFVFAIAHNGGMKFRVITFGLALVFFVAMSFSGTRTAYGMVPLGIGLFFFLTLNNVRVQLVSIVTALGIIVLLVGPFYGPTLNRIRSTFNRDDPSMSFRDQKRQVLQQYIFQNPLGTGLNTANGVARRLTVTADTDNGYLRAAIDKGLQGLFLQLGLFAAAMVTGVRRFYSLGGIDKALCGAYLSGLFALSFAHFYQDVTDQKPLNLILASIYAIIVTFKKL